MPTITVNVADDPGTAFDGTTGGPGTLSYAIAQLNASNPANGPYTIEVTTNVALNGELSPIFGSVTINGNGHTITAVGGTTPAGGLPNRIFFVGTDTASLNANPNSIIGQRQQVTLQDINLNNGTARGGSATDGGGGGLGAGGALFVNQTADVTLSNVNFSGNKAFGGSTTVGTHTGGGGGGLGGAGGAGDPDGGGGGLFAAGGPGAGSLGGSTTTGGGGGGVFGFGGSTSAGGGGFSGYTFFRAQLQLYGISGSGGSSTLSTGATAQGGANGGQGAFSAGGGFGGGNGNANYGNGGNGGFGGGGGQSTSGPAQNPGTRVGNGGDGGFGGGGGAAAEFVFRSGIHGGTGGFGGGGGGGYLFTQGGNGGFGGGGGNGGGPGGNGGFGGGAGSSFGIGGFGGGNGTGSGGAGLGGAVFVVSGGTLTIAGDEVLDGTATAGNGASTVPGSQPSAFGDGIFYQGTDGTTSTLKVGAGNQTFSSSIADYIGSGGTNPGGGTAANNQGGSLAIAKTGTGTLTLAVANTYSGGTTIGSGTVDLGQATSAGSAAITFGTTSGKATGTLVLETTAQVQNGTFGNTLTNFTPGGTLDLKGLTGAVALPVTNNTLTIVGTAFVTGGAIPVPQPVFENYTLSGTSAPTYLATPDGNGGTNITAVVCFASGTCIRTTRGDCIVEDLVVGDVAVTADGEVRPIVWIGHRHIDCCGRHELQPVRVAAHAFGADLPARDLWLSPGHPVLVGADDANEGGHLVPIMCLINGTTIRRVAVDSVTYWHIELDQHDILLAEGLLAESYIDLGSRPWFAGADGALYDPDLALPGMPGRCRPVAIDGPVVESARRRLDQVFASRLASAAAWPDLQNTL